MQKPILIDLDGVLRIGNTIANGARDFIEFIETNNQLSDVITKGKKDKDVL